MKELRFGVSWLKLEGMRKIWHQRTSHVILAEEALLTETALKRLDARMPNPMAPHVGCVGEGLVANVTDKVLAVLGAATLRGRPRAGLVHER